MTGRLPKGADLLAEIRRQGYRPTAPVWLFVDADRPRPEIWSDMPLDLEICIKPTDQLQDLDFWPLVDLDIAVHGGSQTNDRLRAILKRLTHFKPRFLMGGVPAERLLFAWHPARGWEFANV